MPFPISPSSDQTYVNPMGLMYVYDASKPAWEIISQAVLGNPGVTGMVGATGLLGPTGILGQTGPQGFIGITGIVGATGLLGPTGVQGYTGLIGIANFLDRTDYPVIGSPGVIPAVLLWNESDGALFAGVTGLNWIQISAGSSQGTTGIKGQTGLQGVVGATGIGVHYTSKSGLLPPSSFSGTPQKATVTFGSSFSDSSYSINVLSESNRTFTYESKTSSGFVINANSNTALVGNTDWVAVQNGEF